MIQDGLHANEHGLNSLLLELAVAAQLETSGWNVIHHDMEQGDPPTFDIFARKNGREIEVECKFIGGDVGRKVHYRDFIELMKRLDTNLGLLNNDNAVHFINIELNNRLDKSADQHIRIVDLVGKSIATRDRASSNIANVFYHRQSHEGEQKRRFESDQVFRE